MGVSSGAQVGGVCHRDGLWVRARHKPWQEDAVNPPWSRRTATGLGNGLWEAQRALGPRTQEKG